jgi:hypothetical protein
MPSAVRDRQAQLVNAHCCATEVLTCQSSLQAVQILLLTWAQAVAAFHADLHLHDPLPRSPLSSLLTGQLANMPHP